MATSCNLYGYYSCKLNFDLSVHHCQVTNKLSRKLYQVNGGLGHTDQNYNIRRTFQTTPFPSMYKGIPTKLVNLSLYTFLYCWFIGDRKKEWLYWSCIHTVCIALYHMCDVWYVCYEVSVDECQSDQMRISSVELLAMLRIWKRVDPMMTKRKIPSSHGPTCEAYSFF